MITTKSGGGAGLLGGRRAAAGWSSGGCRVTFGRLVGGLLAGRAGWRGYAGRGWRADADRGQAGPMPSDSRVSLRVFVEAAIWGINAFDQWGVEIGKELSGPMFKALGGDDQSINTLDPSSQLLIQHIGALSATAAGKVTDRT